MDTASAVLIGLAFTALNIAITIIGRSNSGVAAFARLEQRMSNIEERERNHKNDLEKDIADIRSQLAGIYREK